MSSHLNVALNFIELFAWLGIFYATARTFLRHNVLADRIRDTLLIALAVSFCLGMVGLFCAATCWIVAAIALVAIARCRGRKIPSLDELPAYGPAYAIVAATLIALFWPQLVRPVLDGDSLLYHLPNAASWVVAHSIWTTSTTYWWYPPGSELLVADVYMLGGVGALPLAGLAGAALLALRLVAFARRAKLEPIPAGLCVSAVLSIPLAAVQVGTLQNDTWLAAFLLEVIWALMHDKPAVLRTAAACAVIKPVGCIFVVVAGLCLSPPLSLALAFIPLGVWFLHDAILSINPFISIMQTSVDNPFQTMIVAHLSAGIPLFFHTLTIQGPTTILFAIVALIIPAVLRPGRVYVVAILFVLLYLFEPFGYGYHNDAQLSSGQSLRFLLPALMVGVVAAFPLLSKFRLLAAVIAFLCLIANIITIRKLFWNDASTHNADLVAIAVLIGFGVSFALRQQRLVPLLIIGLVFYSAANTSRDGLRYYSAEVNNTQAFNWLVKKNPTTVVMWQIRSGIVNVLSPGIRVMDASLDPCIQAKMSHAIIIAADTFAPDPDAFQIRRRVLERCGKTVYVDKNVLIVNPALLQVKAGATTYLNY